MMAHDEDNPDGDTRMKILRLDIKGFRSLKEVSWTPGALNVVIGPNGSGKSNLLRALEMISVSAQGRLGKYVQSWGGMEPLVWDGRTDRIRFSMDLTADASRRAERGLSSYEFGMARLGTTSAFRIYRESLGYPAKEETSRSVRTVLALGMQGLRAAVFNESGKPWHVPTDSLSEEETVLSLASGPFPANRRIPPFRKQLGEWSVYHDFYVGKDAPIRQAAVARFEKRVAPDGQNLTQVLHTLYTGDRDFKKEIDLAMRAAFGDDYDELVFPPAADQRVQLRVRWKSLQQEQSAADLSDGTLRFLFLLAVLASPSPAPVIAIDEPETGLHPSMLPIVAEYAVDAAERAQVILTTHSPEFLDAFGKTRPVTTVAKWADGQTSLTVLDGEELDRWLKEYSLGHLARTGELEGMAR
jgi:predicted ATPase